MPKLKVEDWFTPQPHVKPEDHGHASEFGAFHGSDIKYNRDYDKCDKCGGIGRYWEKVNVRRSRLVNCECEYAKG